jgi:hypothetical protein
MYPKMPAPKARERPEPGYRQRGCVHVILIIFLKLEGRKILLYSD